jgi:tetratricopeptide (TPR) repeat protein
MKKRIFLILINCLVSIAVFCQDFSTAEKQQIDSLNQIINTPKTHDTALANAYVNLTEILYYYKPDTVIHLCNKANSIVDKAMSLKPNKSINNRLKRIKAQSLNNIGFVLGDKGKPKEALVYFELSLALMEELNDKLGVANVLNNTQSVYQTIGESRLALPYINRMLKIYTELNKKEEIAISLNDLGLAHLSFGDNEKAINYFMQSLKTHRENDNKPAMAVTLDNIGKIYLNMKDYHNALIMSNESYKIDSLSNNKRGMALSLNTIGSIYREQNNHTKALEYFNKSLETTRSVGINRETATAINNIGVIYKRQGNLNQALENFNKSLEIFKELGDKLGYASCLMNIGEIYKIKKSFSKASEYYLASKDIGFELGNPWLIKHNSQGLSELYNDMGRHKLALDEFKLYITMRDSINNEESRKATIKSIYKLEYEKKATADSIANAKAIEIKNLKLSKQEAVIKAKRNQQYALFGGLFLVVVFAGFMYNRFKLSQKQNRIIEEKEKETSTQKQIIELKHKEIKSSIEYAKRIQTAILPPPRVVKEFLKNSFTLYLPKDIVAGDFYWMDSPSTEESGQGGEVFIAACDCTGHGVPGAMVSVVCNNALNRAVNEFGERLPGKIFDKARELVLENFEKSDEEVKDGMDASLCALDIKNKKLLWAGANNPLWIIRKNSPSPEELGLGAEVIEYKPDKQPIGKGYDNKPFTTHEISLQEGDIIYLFTDGYADQFGGEKGKKMTKARFREFVLSISHLSMEQQREALLKFHDEYRGNEEQVDDICVIGVRV